MNEHICNTEYKNYLIVQVKSNLFAYQNGTTSWKKVTIRDDFTESSDTLDNPWTPREFPSLTNYQDKFIFLAGGRDPDDHNTEYAEVEMYDIEKNKWSQAPMLS